MLSRNHIAVSTSAVVTTLVLNGATLEQLVIPFVGTSIGAMLVDIDHHNSMISKLFPWTSRVLRLFFTHRGSTHSWLVVLAWYLLLQVPMSRMVYLFVFYLGIGMILHIIEDFFSDESVYFFYPISFGDLFKHLSWQLKKRPIIGKRQYGSKGSKEKKSQTKRLLSYKTGSRSEEIFASICKILTMSMIIWCILRQYVTLEDVQTMISR